MPSLLTILLNINSIKKFLKYKTYTFKNLKITEVKYMTQQSRILIMLYRGRLNIITPLCPDYEHFYFGMGMYKYTFK